MQGDALATNTANRPAIRSSASAAGVHSVEGSFGDGVPITCFASAVCTREATSNTNGLEPTIHSLRDIPNAFSDAVRPVANQIGGTPQLKTRLQKGEQTYLATLVEIKPDFTVDVPNEVADLLKEFADVMPPKLPKFLLPRRATDHKIEWEPGVRPPAQAPYRMAPPQLVKLRKQLKELLDVGFIQPSKAPFGAPVLFQWKRGCALTIGP
ncbi:hypothetical protein F0562_032280 [Nyssa sinensis]|uniref:Reverse transcriptase domain-containing protein n=1 Tax=Nyssa sinensis TaxID=561372 RepID=A0A5J5AS84_9ASTE|nr:hypothetical protein F0562_032280 [Nyssa sinensis]